MTIETLSPDERYIYEERLALLGCFDRPTAAQHKLALNDVERFRWERKPDDDYEK